MFNFYPGLPHDSETEISSGYKILYTLFNNNFMYKHSIAFTSLCEGSEMHLQQVTTHHMLTLIGGMRWASRYRPSTKPVLPKIFNYFRQMTTGSAPSIKTCLTAVVLIYPGLYPTLVGFVKYSLTVFKPFIELWILLARIIKLCAAVTHCMSVH